MNLRNYAKFEFFSIPENIAFARSCVGSFAAQLDCTLEDIEEIKLVVSEAVSNCIIHGYENNPTQMITVMVSIDTASVLEIVVEDRGKGIEDLPRAMEAAYSTDPTRMGLGFTFMKSFTDDMQVDTAPGQGTTVRLRRSFLKNEEALA
jgi:stage II sporulation protein AB (anti-sigma F factor)